MQIYRKRSLGRMNKKLLKNFMSADERAKKQF